MTDEGLRFIDIEDASRVDERGWSINPLTIAGREDMPPGDLHVVSLAPGAVRGNHVHPEAREWIVLCGGEHLVCWKPDPAGDEVREKRLDGNKPFMFEVAPGIPHAVKNVSNAVTHLLSFSDIGTRETLRKVLIR